MKVEEYVKTGWALFRKYPGGFIGFTLITVIIGYLLDYLPYLGSMINLVIGMPLQVGPLIVAFRLLQNKSPEFREFFYGIHYFVPLLLMSLVVILFILVGLISFVLMVREISLGPGLIAAGSLLALYLLFLVAAYLFAPMLVADRRLNFWPAMELSRTTFQRNILGVLGFLGILFLICLAGLLCLGVGLLVAIPVVQCAMAAAYADIFGLRSPEY